MRNLRAKGYLNGVIASTSYGTNPLFALPLFARGFGVNSVLFYRYFFAVVIYGIFLKFFKKTDLKISLMECGALFVFGVIFSLSSILLFYAFQFIDSGIACTILFIYPLMVALISRIFFKEHLPKIIRLALFMVIGGICLLYDGDGARTLNIKGVISVLASALAYAIYMVGIKYSKAVKHIKPDKLTFYVMLFGLSVYVWNLKFCTQLQPLDSWFVFMCAFMLALFPTIISLETITFAIKFIGATKTAILGALEPLTALFFGVLLFGEHLTIKIAAGIIIILSGVIIVILHKDKNPTAKI